MSVQTQLSPTATTTTTAITGDHNRRLVRSILDSPFNHDNKTTTSSQQPQCSKNNNNINVPSNYNVIMLKTTADERQNGAIRSIMVNDQQHLNWEDSGFGLIWA
jgi:hypothetical protein